MPPMAEVTPGVGAPSMDDVVAVARGGAAVALADVALAEIARTRAVIDALAGDTRPHYGVSTGFGALAPPPIPPAPRPAPQRPRAPGETPPAVRTELQRSLIRSHAAGSGRAVEREVVRALMFLRLSTLATG